ncbi:MAG: S (surface)-layer proteins [Treponematales bacterium]
MKGTTKKNFGKSGRSGAVLTLAGLFIMTMALVFGFAGCGDGAGGGDDNGGGYDTANHGFTNIANVYASWDDGSYNGAIELDGTNFKQWGLGTHYDETPYYEGTYTISGSEITLNITKYLGSTSSLGAKRYSYSSADANTVTIGVSALPTSSTSAYTYTKVSAATGSGLHVNAVESSSKATATLTILTEKAAAGLTAADISLSNDLPSNWEAALSVPTKGGLTEVAGSGGHAWRLGVTPTDMGYIKVGVTNDNVTTTAANAAIYKPGATVPYAVYPDTYSNSSTTTKLTLDLFADVEGLTAGDITLTNGTGSATKGALTNPYTYSFDTWYLAITTTAAGTITVKVTKSGVDSADHTVTIHKK